MSIDPASIGLSGELIRIADVTVNERDQMYDLMCQYFQNMDRRSFDQDFYEKDWVIVARHPSQNRIQGFSTQVLIDTSDGLDSKRQTKLLFSGDTIIDKSYWGRNPLAKIWGRLALTLIDLHPDHDLFWFLISKGYKTYRFLPVFFHDFYPRFDAKTPAWATELIYWFANHRYPDRFDEQSGTIRAPENGCQLRSGVAEWSHRQERERHIEFFQYRNPGHARGDELCCIAPLTRSNFKQGAFRVVGQIQTVAI